MKDMLKKLWQWMRRHWTSIAFVATSLAVIACGCTQTIGGISLNVLILGMALLLFLLLEGLRCQFRFRLKFDRVLVQSSFSHLWVAFLTFVFVFDVIIVVSGFFVGEGKSSEPSRVFIDMASPISLRNEIYNLPADSAAVTITTSQDSVSVMLPATLPKQQQEHPAGNALRLTIIYLAGLVVFSGILVATINRFFASRAERYRNGLTHYRFSRHILVVGADDIVISLVKSLLKKHPKTRQIVVVTHTSVDAFRKELFSYIEENDCERIVLQYGEQTSSSDLTIMRPERAVELYVMGDYDFADISWSRHDADNITSLQIIKGILEDKKISKPIPCYVMFEHQSMFTTFQFSDFSTNLRNVLDFMPFNLYEMIAQKTLINKLLDGRGISILPLEGEGIDKESNKHVHLVVMGMTPMGTALALTAAQLCHYPNYVRDKKLKTRITMIDHNADQEMRFFMGRYKDLFSVVPWRYVEANPNNTAYFAATGFDQVPWNTMSEELFDTDTLGDDFVDVEWEFIKGGAEMAEVHSYLRKASNDSDTVLTVAVCENLTHKAVAGGLYLPEEVYDKGLQVLVYQAENNSLIDILASTDFGEKMSQRYRKIHAFGLEKDGMDLSQFDRKLAQCANYIYSTVDYASEDPYGLSDYTLSQMTKEKQLDEWTKVPTSGKTLAANHWSSQYSANTIWTKLRCLKWKESNPFTFEQVEVMSEVEHNRWTMEQMIMNYRPVHRHDTYKSGKEMKINRVHPDIRAYNKLDEGAKKYDRAIVMALPYLYAVDNNTNKEI